MNKNSSKFVTAKVVLNFPHLIHPNKNSKMNDSNKLKYDSAIIISKDDEVTLNRYSDAEKNAIIQGNFSDESEIKLPLKDGDIVYPGDALYKNCYFMYVSTALKPILVDTKLQEIKFRYDEIESGTYAKVSVKLVPYNINGNKGITARLENVQIFPQNKLLELRSNPCDDFEIEEDDDEE